MNANTRRDFRRSTFAGLIGLGVGVGLSGVLAYVFVGPAALPAALRLKTAGRLPTAAADDPDAAKRDEQARRTADALIDGLVKKDAVALASLCGRRFLWGRLDRQRVIEDPAEIRRCFSDELLQGWEPKMYAPGEVGPPRSPHPPSSTDTPITSASCRGSRSGSTRSASKSPTG